MKTFGKHLIDSMMLQEIGILEGIVGESCSVTRSNSALAVLWKYKAGGLSIILLSIPANQQVRKSYETVFIS